MYCPNCKQSFDGKFCPECGAKLIDNPQTSGFNINLGDANAINGGINMTDSHNVHNEDKSVHNISNVSTVTNNVTQVAAQKTEMELIQEKKSLYLNECKRAYEDNVLEQSEVVALEEFRIKIGLDRATADAILDSVRIMTERNAQKTVLNPIAKTKLKILTENLQKNEVKALMDQIDGLEALVNMYDHEELSRKYFLVLAALKPEKCIGLKESSKIDSYWMSFWSYLAYIKVGRHAEAENVLVSLDRFADYPEDNITVLGVAGALMNDKMSEAKEYLESITGDYTPALQRFVDSIYLLLDPEMAKEMSADANTCAFYLVNFFGSAKAKEEARIKAEEEARIKAEEEARIKAEEEARIKAEEEARIKIEEEALAKAVQEAKEKPKSDFVEDNIKYCESESGLTAIEVMDKSQRTYRLRNDTTTLKRKLFTECKSLSSITIPNSVSKITEDTFSHCCSLSDVSIPNSVTKIEGFAFYECKSLSSITIPNSVTTIERDAFNGCESLTSIIIPESVMEIEEQAFYTSSLREVHFKSRVAPRAGGAFILKSIKFYVPKESLSAYKESGYFDGGFFSGVKIIGE